MSLIPPDPIVTANIYCRGYVDDAVRQVITPFWQEIGRASLQAPAAIWVVRYSRRGEHLKVRVHGAEEDRDTLKERLRTHARRWLESLRNAPSTSENAGPAGHSAPPIDPEDEAPGEAPDRILVWTTYRRSPITFGGSPWLEDDAFVALAATCLAHGFEQALTSDGAAAMAPGNDRRKTLVKMLVRAAPALGFDLDRLAGYLEYHREWLLRFFLATEAEAERMRQLFDGQARRSAGMVERLRALLVASTPQSGAWERAIGDLAAYTGTFQGRPAYRIDPFTAEVSFPPIFKVLHGLANQLGLRPLDEASVHHLLLAAIRAASAPAMPRS